MTEPTIKPAPEGVTISIPKVWQTSLTGSPINSLTDPSVDEPVLTISTAKLEEFGAGGLDKVNFLISAELAKLGYVANVAIAIAWDPEKHPHAPLMFQTNLKSASHVEASYREPFLPKYPYMRRKGTHDLIIMAQLREVTTTWQHDEDDYVSFTEYPRIGVMAIRKIKVIITE